MMVRDITLGSILESLPLEIFRQGKQTQSDPYQIGYRTVHPTKPIKIKFAPLRSVTAEGLNMLAVLQHSLRSSDKKYGFSVGLSEDIEVAQFFRVLGIDTSQLIWATEGIQPLVNRSPQFWSCGPFLCPITSEQQVLESARGSAESIIIAASEWDDAEMRGELHDSIQRLVLESLFNIYEHAYPTTRHNREAFATIIVQPASRILADRKLIAKEEFDWLDSQHNKLCIEIAISDIGRGVPRTLWQWVNRRDPGIFDKLKMANPGSNVYAQCRSKVHESILVYAFEHESSQKSAKQFADHYHEVNWRGLYRSRQQVAKSEGMISITSGKGRVGFCAIGNEKVFFSKSISGKIEMPGTTLTIRLPVSSTRKTRVVGIRDLTLVERSQAIILDPNIRPFNHIISPNTFPGVKFSKDDIRDNILGIALPFTKLSSEHHLLQDQVASIPLAKLFEALSLVPPHVVPILFFSNAEAAIFRAVSQRWSPLTGYPRLWAVWNSERKQLLWRLAGVYCQEAEEMLVALEHTGHYKITPNASKYVIETARELSINYASFIQYNETDGKLKIIKFSATVSERSIKSAFDLAFRIYWSMVEEDVVRKGPVLVPSGERVANYICVLYLIEGSALLASTLSEKLRAIIRDGNVVADNHGSEFIAQLLLQQRGETHPIRRGDSVDLAIGSKLFIFTDAIYNVGALTQMINDLAGKGYKIGRLICIVDVRNKKDYNKLAGIPVTSLVDLPYFNIAELDSAEMSTMDVQVDRLTHVPVETEASTFSDIACTSEAQKLFFGHSIFTHGFHFLGQRLHTISAPASKLLNSYLDESLECLAERMRPFLKKHCLPSTHVCFFFRKSSQLGKVIGRLHDVLVEKELVALSKTFQVSLPTKTLGSKAIFTHPDLPLYHNCCSVEVGQLNLLPGVETASLNAGNFLAIFVDDAAVSGKALRNFLYRVSSEHQKPKAVLGLLLVNRLSPV
ncbi:MAG: hypothetical protein OJI67_22570, partial [Prosthecobacter sp.]|nr:hypothetical protein [Prosthecobacter sp.]